MIHMMHWNRMYDMYNRFVRIWIAVLSAFTMCSCVNALTTTRIAKVIVIANGKFHRNMCICKISLNPPQIVFHDCKKNVMCLIVNSTHTRNLMDRANYKTAFLEVKVMREENERVFVLRNWLMRAKIIAQDN